MKLYEARCTRERDWWSIEVVDPLAGQVICYTQARRLAQVPDVVEDAVRTLLDDPNHDMAVAVFHQLGDDLERLVSERRNARAHATDAAEAAARTDAETAKALVDAGITVRDAGQILGLSFQRVAQLVSSATTTTVSGGRRSS